MPVLSIFRLRIDRKSTRLNSSHLVISYAVFCLKKKRYHRWGIFLECERTHHHTGHSCDGIWLVYSVDDDTLECRTTKVSCYSIFFFFNDTAPTEISPLSLHDALPI